MSSLDLGNLGNAVTLFFSDKEIVTHSKKGLWNDLPKATQLLSGELSGDQRLGSTLFQVAKNTDFIGLNLSARNNLDIKICVPNLQFSNFDAETQEAENTH